MTSPKVIFNCKFTHAFNRREENYTAKQIEGLKKKIARKFDYFSNEDKRVMNLFDYYTGELNKNKKMNHIISLFFLINLACRFLFLKYKFMFSKSI